MRLGVCIPRRLTLWAISTELREQYTVRYASAGGMRPHQIRVEGRAGIEVRAPKWAGTATSDFGRLSQHIEPAADGELRLAKSRFFACLRPGNQRLMADLKANFIDGTLKHQVFVETPSAKGSHLCQRLR